MGWLADYNYRKRITIDGSATAPQTDYTLKLIVHKGSGASSGNEVYLNDNCKVNFDDIRFTKSDGSSELSHWRQEFIENDLAVFWIEFDSIPQSAPAYFYIYYDNPGASSASNDALSFLVGADFDDGTTTGLTINTAGAATVTVPAITKLLNKIKVDDWIKCYQLNPVLAKRTGKWDSLAVRDLAPVMSEDGYLVYESGKIIALHGGRILGGGWQVGRATSSDRGLTWGDRLDSPVIAFNPGSWYDHQVFPGCVVKRASDGVYVAFITGEDASHVGHIGCFTSVDLGLNWTNQGIRIEGENYVGLTGMALPWVIKRDTDYIMLFEGTTAGGYRIFAATATELTGIWTPFNGGNPIITVGAGGQWDDSGTANPKLVRLAANEYLLAYNGVGGGSSYWRVGFATATTDLTSWTKHTGNPVIVGEGTGWEQTHTECSALVKDESTYLRFWYQGFEADMDVAQIGFAKNHQGRLLWAKSPAAADGWIVGSMQPNAFWASILARHTADASGIDSTCGIHLADFSSVPSPMANTAWNPKVRIVVWRISPTSTTNPNKFVIYYMDTGGGFHSWDGDSWEAGETRFGGKGLYEVRIWDDGTNFKIDIVNFWTGISILTAVASIAKSSVKAFTDGRALLYEEAMTSHYYLGQYFDNAIVKKYVEPEPTWGNWGNEETEAVVGSKTAHTAAKLVAAGMI